MSKERDVTVDRHVTMLRFLIIIFENSFFFWSELTVCVTRAGQRGLEANLREHPAQEPQKPDALAG